MGEKKIAEKLECDTSGNCQEDIKKIMERLGAGAEIFVQLNGKIELCQRELELIWDWKRSQNGDLKIIKETLHSLDKDGIKNLAAQSEKINERIIKQLKEQKAEIEALVKPVVDAVGVLQKADSEKRAVGMFKNKTLESGLRYIGGGTAIILSLWKIWELASPWLQSLFQKAQ